MKKVFLILYSINLFSFFLLIFLGQSSVASIFNKYTYMTIEEAKEKWGYEKLDKKKFKASGHNGDLIKAKMAAFILENQTYKGEKISIVYEELGAANGYFISDIPPTYILLRSSKKLRETWQLAFIPTKDGKRIKEVKIVKTCCDKK